MSNYKPTSKEEAQAQQQLLVELMSPEIRDDPHAFVMLCFPWGKANTPLADYKGPRKWQVRVLNRIRDHIRECRRRGLDDLPGVLKIARCAGRGIGKSAFVCWLMWWMYSTRLGSTVQFTANTEEQMKSTTWAEMGKWHTLAINGHWYDRMVLQIRPCPWFDEMLRDQLKIDTGYYYILGKTWKQETPGAFAGTHNPLGFMLVFEEAADIPPEIWDVSEGFFTEERCIDRYWFAISNGRRNTGSFFECFHKHRDVWDSENIDGRDVEGTDKRVYESIIARDGPDSDLARIEVYGLFPNHGTRQLMGRLDVRAAMERELVRDDGAALIMGCDISRGEGDLNSVSFRAGSDARSIPSVTWKSRDTTYTVSRIAELIDKYSPDAVAVDEDGVGGPVIDRLRALGYKIHGVKNGSKAISERYADVRTECWVRLSEALGLLCLEKSKDLEDDLCGPEIDFQSDTSDKLKLESKRKMKARGLHSPDQGDSLAMTYSIRVPRKDSKNNRLSKRGKMAIMDTSVFT